jgi:hypothetical protein
MTDEPLSETATLPALGDVAPVTSDCANAQTDTAQIPSHASLAPQDHTALADRLEAAPTRREHPSQGTVFAEAFVCIAETDARSASKALRDQAGEIERLTIRDRTDIAAINARAAAEAAEAALQSSQAENARWKAVAEGFAEIAHEQAKVAGSVAALNTRCKLLTTALEQIKRGAGSPRMAESLARQALTEGG